MKDLTVIMEDRPGSSLSWGRRRARRVSTSRGSARWSGTARASSTSLVQDEATAKTALGTPGSRWPTSARPSIVDLHNKPGAMGEIARDLAEAGVSVDVAYTIFSGVRLVIVTEDSEKARAALDLDGASG